MPCVGILKEPIFTRALMGPLALDDMGTHKFDTAMDELTDQLRLETQEKMREVSKVRGLERESSLAVGGRCKCAGVMADGVVKGVKSISHVDDQLLEFVYAQAFDDKVSFARKEQLVVCSKSGQRQGVEAGGTIDVGQ